MMVRMFVVRCDSSGCKAEHGSLFAEDVRREAAAMGWSYTVPAPGTATGSGMAGIDYCPTHRNNRCGAMFMGVDPCVLPKGHRANGISHDCKTQFHLDQEAKAKP